VGEKLITTEDFSPHGAHSRSTSSPIGTDPDLQLPTELAAMQRVARQLAGPLRAVRDQGW